MSDRTKSAPWRALDPSVADALRPALPRLVGDVIAAVKAAVPMYEGVLDSNVQRGVHQALDGFLELVAGGDEASLPGRQVYVSFGRGESRNGRTLEALLTAYRAGAQVAWRGLAEEGERAGLEPRAMYTLAEAVFAYIDELSSASAEGFAREQSALAQERQERRRRMIELLLHDPRADPAQLEQAARAVPWDVPRRLAVVVFPEDAVRAVEPRLPGDALVAAGHGLATAVVPDPDAPKRRSDLERALRGHPAGIGSAVMPAAARRSAREAELAFGLAQAGVEPAMVYARERLLDLMLAQDPELAAELARSALAPFDVLSPATRERLLGTLSAWLACHGSASAAAERLHVHVQTVRYRLDQVRDLLGSRLDDADGRLELQLALRISGTPSPQT
ncbi:MAG TPA: helix-turn-helix domain-containing protein [Thermoleophilaceae bacterium]